MKILGVRYWGIMIPHNIQLREYSMSGEMDDISHISFEGDRQVPNVWLNDAKRNANLNWFDKKWNDNYWFAFSR